jgi:sugar/nucleoside kinase (ribokinase family)/energy-coupling factor transporter ATP-binding protein EcfA2
MDNKSANLFVIGDLIIDHTVFIQSPTVPHKGLGNEDVYEVVRRIDTAGGAANSARILAVLNYGKTSLWGVLGKSNWGDFRTIISNCHAMDGANSNVEFRGVRDETQAQMNTVTRLIMVEGTPPHYDSRRTHKARFDDYGHIHVSEDKRRTLLYYLDRANQKDRIDGIIINDFDMNCLTPELVKEIAKFAKEQNPPIPLFVDPKRERKKYSGIEGTAIFPHLSEWCYLVEQKDGGAENRWKKKLERPEGLSEMAQLSFRYLGNFVYHIIKCGELGAVILAPHPEKNDRYAAYRVERHPTKKLDPPPQIGCGDVMTAIFALEFSRSRQDTNAAIDAFLKANAVVACYRDMSWNRMPSREAVADAQKSLIRPSPVTEPSKGMLFLPKKNPVELSEYETAVGGLFSLDSTFQNRIRDLLDDISLGWREKLKSIILGAPSGCGKSTIVAELKGRLSERFGISVVEFKEPKTDINWNDLERFFSQQFEEKGAKTGKLLVVLDEALKEPTASCLKEFGVKMLNAAHDHNTRFLFIDALFQPSGVSTVNSEFTSRCVPFYLSGLAERPIDIPYIVAERVFVQGKNKPFSSIRVEGLFLLAVTNAILSNPNPRLLCNWVDAACEAAFIEWNGVEPLNIRSKHLIGDIRLPTDQPSEIIAEAYSFHRTK